jgi:hypothetical protein
MDTENVALAIARADKHLNAEIEITNPKHVFVYQLVGAPLIKNMKETKRKEGLLISSYPKCCAMAVIHDFPSRYVWEELAGSRNLGRVLSARACARAKAILKVLPAIVTALDKDRTTIIQAVLSEDQIHPTIVENLHELGFRVFLEEHVNPKTGHKITIYQRVTVVPKGWI